MTSLRKLRQTEIRHLLTVAIDEAYRARKAAASTAHRKAYDAILDHARAHVPPTNKRTTYTVSFYPGSETTPAQCTASSTAVIPTPKQLLATYHRTKEALHLPEPSVLKTELVVSELIAVPFDQLEAAITKAVKKLLA